MAAPQRLYGRPASFHEKNTFLYDICNAGSQAVQLPITQCVWQSHLPSQTIHATSNVN